MRFSILVSVTFAATSVLAIPLQQSEGKSSTVQIDKEVDSDFSERTSPILNKRNQCNKGKTETSSGYIAPSSAVDSSHTTTPTGTTYEESRFPAPSSYKIATGNEITSHRETNKAGKATYITENQYGSRNSRGGRTGGGRNRGGSRNNTFTPTTPDDETTTGNSPYQSSSSTNAPSYEEDTTSDAPTSYLSMPAGSSTGLKRGSSVRNVGPDGTFMSESAIKPYLVAAHNLVRALHEGTGSITWDTSIAKLAEANTPNCDFKHTPSAQRKGLGENISYNTNANPEDQALRQWYANEVVNYNFANPSNSNGVIGHMTAMVWKDVRSFGCAVRNCGSHGMGLYLKCNYSPVPNIIGKYDQQVGTVKGASTESQIRKIVAAATGFTPK